MDKLNAELKRLEERRKCLTPPFQKIGVLVLFGDNPKKENPKVLHGTTVKFPVHKVCGHPELGKVDFEKSLSFTLDKVNKHEAQELMLKFLDLIFSEGGFEFQNTLYSVDKEDYKLLTFDGSNHVNIF